MSENGSLTDEQKKFLAECEELFKDRYTEHDTEFMKIKNAEPKDPPIAYPWSNRSRGNRWSRQNNHQRNRRNENWERRRYDNDASESDRRGTKRHHDE